MAHNIQPSADFTYIFSDMLQLTRCHAREKSGKHPLLGNIPAWSAVLPARRSPASGRDSDKHHTLWAISEPD